MALSMPGKKSAEPAAPPAPLTRLEERREVLRGKFTELQWDLGGAAYEMAARDYFRLDVLASMAARLQVVDAELAEIERMARLERAGAAGACAGCGSLFARGAVYCWRCGRNLDEKTVGTIVGPSVAGEIEQPPAPEPAAPEPWVEQVAVANIPQEPWTQQPYVEPVQEETWTERPAPPPAPEAAVPAQPSVPWTEPEEILEPAPVPVSESIAEPDVGPLENGNGYAPAPDPTPTYRQEVRDAGL